VEGGKTGMDLRTAFDLDGTIFDTVPGFIEEISKAGWTVELPITDYQIRVTPLLPKCDVHGLIRKSLMVSSLPTVAGADWLFKVLNHKSRFHIYKRKEPVFLTSRGKELDEWTRLQLKSFLAPLLTDGCFESGVEDKATWMKDHGFKLLMDDRRKTCKEVRAAGLYALMRETTYNVPLYDGFVPLDVNKFKNFTSLMKATNTNTVWTYTKSIWNLPDYLVNRLTT
jgi:hypothetical protein